jgi:hypothetical protein
VGLILMASLLATDLNCTMKSPWSRWEDPRRRWRLWLHARATPEDVVGGYATDRCNEFLMYISSPKALRGNLASAISWARRHRLSKVLVMIEDEQCSLDVLEPVAAILYLPNEVAVWLCFVPYHLDSQHASIESSVKLFFARSPLLSLMHNSLVVWLKKLCLAVLVAA